MWIALEHAARLVTEEIAAKMTRIAHSLLSTIGFARGARRRVTDLER
jgi:predicted O-methyltransferase YrrM